MDTEEYLTPPKDAHRLRVDDYTVRQWINTGALEAEFTCKLLINENTIFYVFDKY
jgi:hypothetical protein